MSWLENAHIYSLLNKSFFFGQQFFQKMQNLGNDICCEIFYLCGFAASIECFFTCSQWKSMIMKIPTNKWSEMYNATSNTANLEIPIFQSFNFMVPIEKWNRCIWRGIFLNQVSKGAMRPAIFQKLEHSHFQYSSPKESVWFIHNFLSLPMIPSDLKQLRMFSIRKLIEDRFLNWRKYGNFPKIATLFRCNYQCSVFLENIYLKRCKNGNVFEIQVYKNQKFTGAILANGEYWSTTNDELGFLTIFNANPLKICKELGFLQKICVFCQRPLVDKDSLEIGYGKTCAIHRGLPWVISKKRKKI